MGLGLEEGLLRWLAPAEECAQVRHDLARAAGGEHLLAVGGAGLLGHAVRLVRVRLRVRG